MTDPNDRDYYPDEGENVAESIRPGMRKRRFREEVRESTGDHHRDVQVDEQTWDYLMDMKGLFGLDNMRQTMVLVRHLAIFATTHIEQAAQED